MAWINNTGMSAKDARRWGNDGLSQMRKDNHYKEQENRSERASNEKRIKQLESQVAAQKKAAPAPKAAPPKPKPGPQQIEPVKASPEISAAQKVVNSYQSGLKDKKSPWEQAQSNVSDSSQFGNFNPGGDSSDPTSGNDQVNQMKQDSQDFADKYKLNLINSGATK